MKRALLMPAVAALMVAAVSGPSATQVAAQPERPQHIYITSVLTDEVVGVQVSPTDAPRVVSRTPVPDGGTLKGIVSSPDGRFLYIGPFFDQGIAAYSINADGTLDPLAGSPVASSGPVGTLAVAPDGRYLYASSTENARGVLTTFAIGASGLPVKIATTQLDLSSHFGTLAVAPDGRNLYVADGFGNQMMQLPIGADGVAGAPVQRIDAGGPPLTPIVTPDGKHLYVAHELNATIGGFNINPDGSLVKTPDTPVESGLAPHGVTLSPDGSRVYVPNGLSNHITGYQINADGTLTPLPGSPYSTGADPISAPGQLFSSRDGKRMYAIGVLTLSTSFGARVLTFDVSADGALHPSEPAVETGQIFPDGPASAITP
ncbi:lactonase family protein [Nocardia harenae]|uniref:lactonase family protein n=1 Tax=Nocardia harenae TaxID=358707 RepID=UPI00082F8A90|nr:beta-propeller fold lactonase family protein [Nocardia harenae]